MTAVFELSSWSWTIDGALTADVAAQGTLTMATQPTDADTITIGSKTYTWEDTLTDVDGNIYTGADLAGAQSNFLEALDLSGTAGTDYATSMTANTDVTATAWATNDLVLTAVVTGTAGNSIATTSSLTAGGDGFDDTTLGTTRAGVDAKRLSWVAPAPGTIKAVYGAVGTAPTGSALLVDVNKGGTTIFTTQSNRVTIADAASSGSAAAVEVTDFAAGDVFQIYVDQIGSGTAGSDLTLTFAIGGDTTPTYV